MKTTSFKELEDAKAFAEAVSKEEGVVQHVNFNQSEPEEKYEVSDWYTQGLTIISYEKGLQL